MADKRIIKNTRRQAAVVVTGTGTATINIYEVAYSGQTVDAANVQLDITDVMFSTITTGNVTRDSNVIISFPANMAAMFNISQQMGVSLNDKNSANIVVNLGASEGTVLLQLSKTAGYIDQNRQNQGPGSL